MFSDDRKKLAALGKSIADLCLCHDTHDLDSLIVSVAYEIARIAKARWYASNEVVITRDELESLQHSEERLDALEAHGVDNWEGYSEAISSLNQQ